MMKKIIAFILLLFVVGACQKTEEMKEEYVTTKDNVKIAYNFLTADSDKGVILVHMLSRNKETWNDFAQELQKNNYNVIAIDMRGHGQSDLDFKTFSDEDFNKIVFDIGAAHDFLAKKGISKVYLIGASIGANNALNYAANHSLKALVLLSPGENYHGVKTLESIKKLKTLVLIVTSQDDAQSYGASQKLFELAQQPKEFKLYTNAGHGTNMFGSTDLDTVIVEFLEKH